MHLPPNSWPNSDIARSTLLFAQTMKQLLNTNAFESFRAYSLDTPSRIDEAIGLVKTIHELGINIKTFDPVYDELIWSLKSDPFINTTISGDIEYYSSRINLNNNSPHEVQAILKHLKRKISVNYKARVEQEIISLIRSSTQRNKLREITGLYCTHLLNLGYSSQYILQRVNNVYFSRDIRMIRAQLTESFFKSFGGSYKNYQVYVAVNLPFAKYLSRLNNKVLSNTTDIPNGARNIFLNYLENQTYQILNKRISALDVYKAAHETEEYLNSQKSTTYLDPNEIPCEWKSETYVTPFNSTKGSLIEIQPFLLDRPSFPIKGKILSRLEKYSKKIATNFEPSSLERVRSSINTAALSVSSHNRETSLISIWSAFEVLLSNPPSGARISHYARLITPCICRRYIRIYIGRVYDDLWDIYERKLLAIISQEQNITAKNNHLKFAAVLLLPENELLRSKLLKLCSTNPLALQRISYIHKEFSSPKSILRCINSHEKRVFWQLHRIYRARNNLVHAGNVPSYLDSLIRNAFEYYRSTIASVVKCAERDTNKSNIDDAVIECSVLYEQSKRHLEKMASQGSIDVHTLNIIFE